MKLSTKLLSAFLAVTLLLSLAGCGGKNEPAKEKLTAIADLETEKLAAQRGTIGHILAEELVGEENVDNVTTYEKYVDAVTSLEQGKVRAVIMDERPAKRFVEEKGNMIIMEEPLSNESYAIALKKGNDELKARIDAALDEMKADGSLQSIIDKYNSDVEVKPEDIDLNTGAAGGTLIMGTEAGFAPYELKVGDGYIGIDVEMAAAIAKKMDMELVIENMNFDSLPSAVNSGKVDMIVAGLTVTPEREENMTFSVAYVEDARQVALVMSDDYAASDK
ncbi:MAG: transporter substrate-binding domain-containing protein [Fastidiosipilaceae bacterium]|jgi:ABC-type amino acid transport substrate-binding protein